MYGIASPRSWSGRFFLVQGETHGPVPLSREVKRTFPLFYFTILLLRFYLGVQTSWTIWKFEDLSETAGHSLEKKVPESWPKYMRMWWTGFEPTTAWLTHSSRTISSTQQLWLKEVFSFWSNSWMSLRYQLLTPIGT